MKRIATFVLVLILTLSLCACGAAPAAPTTEPQVAVTGSKMRHMSFNILGSKADHPGFENEEKRNNIKAIIEEIDPDTFGVQEAHQPWTDGLAGLLDNKYAMAAGHSDPKVTRPAYQTNAVFYKVDKFNYLDSGLYYLDNDGAYSFAGSNCGYVLLERKEDGALILVMNLHLSWRALGSKELLEFNQQNFNENTADTHFLRDMEVTWAAMFAQQKTQEYAAQYGKTVTPLLSGDFNVESLDQDQPAHKREYDFLTTNMKMVGLKESALVAKALVTNQDTDQWVTYRNSKSRIDYIFIDDTIVPETFTVHKLEKSPEITSDHLPVYLDYYIKK